MEDGNETFSDHCESILESLGFLEQTMKSKGKTSNDKRTACRQQYILFKSVNERVADDFAMRNWMQHYCVECDQEFHKDLNILFSNNESYRNIEFPSIDLTCSANFDTHQDSYFRIHLEKSKNVALFTDEPMVSNIASSSSKTRNTMENFLHGHMPIETSNFKSARQILAVQSLKNQKQGDREINKGRATASYSQKADTPFNFSATKKSLGLLGRVGNSSRKNFISPKRSESSTNEEQKCVNNDSSGKITAAMEHPSLKNVDSKMVEIINSEIIHEFTPVDWNQIAGLHYAKSIIKEAVIYPLLRPDIFTGLRRPPKGILLFGPPGTGKTLIGKCIASQSSSTFFNISSATLTSKWMGDGEKMVRALFAVAAVRQPSVIFIDEIDALLSQRSENENEGTRRLKTEFLVRIDGTSTSDDDRVLIVGATNRPQELDEAVRRRFVKRLYVPLPEAEARAEILSNLLKTVENNLSTTQIEEVSKLTDGYSGADMDSLCREASMEPLRSLSAETIITYPKESLRNVNIEDFYIALKKIRPSVSQNDLSQLVEWNKLYGSSF